MSEMLEKVCNALILEWDGAEFDPSDADAWPRLARAAVEALIEPDEAMVRAGFREVTDLCRTNVPYDLRRERVARSHSAMLQTILEEQP